LIDKRTDLGVEVLTAWSTGNTSSSCCGTHHEDTELLWTSRYTKLYPEL